LLTLRERDVLGKLVTGCSNKVTAYDLGISSRTVEIHRASIMDKMDVSSLSGLVRVQASSTKRSHLTPAGLAVDVGLVHFDVTGHRRVVGWRAP